MSNAMSGQQSQPYAYEPLAPGRWIRIIEVQGSESHDTNIRCKLKQEHLESNPSYEAISYAWEGQNPSHHINCDGLDLLVTENVANILRHFRPNSAKMSRCLWIDAVCIDQKSVLEKNHQLKLMADVYHNATCVLVWLDASKTKQEFFYARLFRWLCQLSSLAAQEESGIAIGAGDPKMIGGIVALGPPLDYADWAIVYKCQEILKYSEHYGFGLFENIAWFTRLWTVQEVAMAKEALLVLGEDTLCFSAIGRLYMELGRLSPYDSAVADVRGGLLRVLGPHFTMQHDLWKAKQGQKSFCSLNDFSGLTVSDPKDKIFAVQGFLSAMGVVLPDADYSKPLSTIQLEAYRALIIYQGQIGVISELSCCCMLQTASEVASWIPQSFGKLKPNVPVTIPLKKVQKPNFWFSEDALRLHAYGLRIDVVVSVSESFIGSFSAENASRLPQDVRARLCAGTVSHRNLASELYGIQTILRWITFAIPQAPVSFPEQALEALHSCMRLDSSSDAYVNKRSYDNFIEWLQVLAKASRHVQNDQLIREGIGSEGNYHASLIETCSKEQETDYLMAMDEFRILTLISKSKTLSDWQRLLQKVGYMALFETASGKLGIGTFPIQAGDLVVHIFGNNTPLCLRLVNTSKQEYKIVAPAYVHAIVEDVNWNENSEGYQEFTIV